MTERKHYCDSCMKYVDEAHACGGPISAMSEYDEYMKQKDADDFNAAISGVVNKVTERKFLPRVWIRDEPWHESALIKGEVVQTDIANHYARRGSHWEEYVHISEVEAIVAPLVKALERVRGIAGEPTHGPYSMTNIEAISMEALAEYKARMGRRCE